MSTMRNPIAPRPIWQVKLKSRFVDNVDVVEVVLEKKAFFLSGEKCAITITKEHISSD